MNDDTRDIEFLRSLDDDALLAMFGHGSDAILFKLGTRLREQAYKAAQADNARQKAAKFDQRVLNLLTNIERRRKVPFKSARDRVARVAEAILHEDGGNPDSNKRRVRESLRRLGLR